MVNRHKMFPNVCLTVLPSCCKIQYAHLWTIVSPWVKYFRHRMSALHMHVGLMFVMLMISASINAMFIVIVAQAISQLFFQVCASKTWLWSWFIFCISKASVRSAHNSKIITVFIKTVLLISLVLYIELEQHCCRAMLQCCVLTVSRCSIVFQQSSIGCTLTTHSNSYTVVNLCRNLNIIRTVERGQASQESCLCSKLLCFIAKLPHNYEMFQWVGGSPTPKV